jgi:hypothetical protein
MTQFLLASTDVPAAAVEGASEGLRQVQQYNFSIGILAMLLVGFGFLMVFDTCGVHNLHGMPGLLGGIVGIVAVPAAAKAQITGIIFTVIFALIAGVISGLIIRATGKKELAYEDSDEFLEG